MAVGLSRWMECFASYNDAGQIIKKEARKDRKKQSVVPISTTGGGYEDNWMMLLSVSLLRAKQKRKDIVADLPRSCSTEPKRFLILRNCLVNDWQWDSSQVIIAKALGPRLPCALISTCSSGSIIMALSFLYICIYFLFIYSLLLFFGFLFPFIVNYNPGAIDLLLGRKTCHGQGTFGSTLPACV